MATQWDRVKEVFAEALEREPAEREAFLNEACGSDPDVRPHVEELLQLHESRGDFLAALPIEQQPQGAFKDGDVIAERFRIVRLLGSGGMGRVYEAEDLELGGRIALKTLHPELLTDSGGLRRFRREIQLARKVTHPNVCRIFDVGHHEFGGKDYVFVSMELLPGITLSQHIHSEGKLSPPEALRTARQMAEGLRALHECNIIHRDFKPGNVILVPTETGEPRAVITDFGLARTVERDDPEFSEVTRPSQIIGTPDYMAPEQLVGDPVTPSTDVYAFGVVLYEMTTGRRPFSTSQFAKAAVEKTTRSPEPPSKYTAELNKHWVATISKCLEADPTRRFSCTTEAVRAIEGSSPHSVFDRSLFRFFRQQHGGQQARRRRWVFGVAAVVALLCLLVAAGTYPSGIRAAFSAIGIRLGPELPAEIRLAILPLEGRGEATLSGELLSGLTEAVTEKAARLESLRDSLLILPPDEVLRREVRDAAGAAEKLGANLVLLGSVRGEGSRLRVEAELIDAVSRETIDSFEASEPREETVLLRNTLVVELARVLEVDLPEDIETFLQDPTRPDSSQSYAYYLQGRGYLQRYDDLENVDKSIQLFHRALGDDPSYALAYAGLGEAHWRKYQLLKDANEADLANQNASTAVTYSQEDPAVHITLGIVHRGRGRHEEAVADFHRALELDPRNAAAMRELGRTYEALNAFEQAEQTMKDAISLRPQLWTSHSRLAGFYYRRGRYKEAAERFRRVVELNPNSSQAYLHLGAALYQLERWTEARQAFERSVEIQPRAATLSNLATLYYQEKRYEEAVAAYKKALELNDGDYKIWANLASAYHQLGDPAAASTFEEVVKRAEETLQVNPDDGYALSYSAWSYTFLGKESEALKLITRAQNLSPTDITVLINATRTYLRLGDRSEALAAAREAIERGYPLSLIERGPAYREIWPELQAEFGKN